MSGAGRDLRHSPGLFLLREPLGFTCGAGKLKILTLWSVSPLEVSVFTYLIKVAGGNLFS